MKLHHNLPGLMALLLLAGLVAEAAAQNGTSLDFTFRNGPRQLAPGVLKVIPPEQLVGETFTGPRSIVEITQGIPGLEWTPHYKPETQTLLQKAQKTIYRRPIWGLEFAFKPVRMMYVDIPQPNGNLERKLIWYMMYRVTNRGGHWQPVAKEDEYGFTTYDVNRVNELTGPNGSPEPIRFYPLFALRSHEEDRTRETEYLDRTIPIAVRAIQNREDPYTHLYSTAEMGQIAIPLSTAEEQKPVWGVAVWENVDPRIDHFSVYVRGLTNAQRFAESPNFPVGGAPTQGRVYSYKTLQLNFWRPGDERRETEDEVHYGVPVFPEASENERMLSLYSLENRVDNLWIYR